MLIVRGVYATSVAELNQQTQNPIAALTSVPFQNNWTFNVGPNDQTQYIMNLQPVIPYQLNQDWNLIMRMVMPLISQPQMSANVSGAFGLADTDVTFFLSPISSSKFIWGIGPVISIPTATSRDLGSSRWGLGPSIVLLTQQNHWTIGLLTNQIWTLGGTNGDNGINNLFIQPFISYSLNASWNLSFTSETNYNWNAAIKQRWTVPLDLVLVKVLMLGKQALTIGAGPRYFAKFPGEKPRWGARLVISFLFPKN